MIRLVHHLRLRRPAEGTRSITAGIRLIAILLPGLLFTAVISHTSRPEVELPAVGSAGNASGQVALPALSVEIHDGGVTVYESDDLIEILPWAVDGAEVDDLGTVLQEVGAAHPECQAVDATGCPPWWRHRTAS